MRCLILWIWLSEESQPRMLSVASRPPIKAAWCEFGAHFKSEVCILWFRYFFNNHFHRLANVTEEPLVGVAFCPGWVCLSMPDWIVRRLILTNPEGNEGFRVEFFVTLLFLSTTGGFDLVTLFDAPGANKSDLVKMLVSRLFWSRINSSLSGHEWRFCWKRNLCFLICTRLSDLDVPVFSIGTGLTVTRLGNRSGLMRLVFNSGGVDSRDFVVARSVKCYTLHWCSELSHPSDESWHLVEFPLKILSWLVHDARFVIGQLPKMKYPGLIPHM